MEHSTQDRCDKCRAQGYTTWETPDGLPLTFCNHHTNVYTISLVEQGFKIIADDTRILCE